MFFRLLAPLMALVWLVLAVYGVLSPNGSDIGELNLQLLEVIFYYRQSDINGLFYVTGIGSIRGESNFNIFVS